MRVVVVGARGMLGHDTMNSARSAGMTATGLDLPEIDITSLDGLSDSIPDCDWIVNCAAYTQVDKAESNRQIVFAVNRDGAHNLAGIAAARGIALVQLSTDYVFDGTATRDYREDDPTHPVNVYGASKEAGELAVRSERCRSLIVRTQALFGRNGRNFVATVLGLFAKGSPLRIVDDQTACPTYTPHLADALVRLIQSDYEGTVHVSASGKCTWFELAKAIGGLVRSPVGIEPISSAELDTPARRPLYSVLDKARFESWTGHALPSWEEGLAGYMAAMAGTTGRVVK